MNLEDVSEHKPAKCSYVDTAKEATNPSSFALSQDRPTKIVHVGHSDGSIVTIYLLLHGARATPMHRAAAPPLLTGFKIGPKFAQLEVGDARSCRGQAGFDNPLAFGDRGSGLPGAGIAGRGPGGWLPQIDDGESTILDCKREDQADRRCRRASIAGGRGWVCVQWIHTRGPVMVFTGERDFLFCAGEGNRAYDLEQIKGLYPDSARVEVALQPETGLVLILSTSATAGYAEMCSHIASLMACGQRHNRAPTRR
ncbi:hypothetical protein PG990_000253 [Apiospora arundinis]